MNKTILKKYWKWFQITALAYILIGVALYFLQDKIIFRPEKLAAGYIYKFNIPFREIDLSVNEEKNLSIVQFTVPDSVRKGIVLYFHGNRININRYAPFAANFTKSNYEVWMMDYPGYGKSTGKRTEGIIYADALLFYKMAIRRVAADSIIIYGKSLGTGIAAQLASVRDCKRLILETPYYSIEALMNTYLFMYPVSLMMKYHFPTYQYFEDMEAPVSIFHGTNDKTIPLSQSKRLQKIKPATELVIIEKGKHNNLNDFPLYHQKLDSLLKL